MFHNYLFLRNCFILNICGYNTVCCLLVSSFFRTFVSFILQIVLLLPPFLDIGQMGYCGAFVLVIGWVQSWKVLTFWMSLALLLAAAFVHVYRNTFIVLLSFYCAQLINLSDEAFISHKGTANWLLSRGRTLMRGLVFIRVLLMDCPHFELFFLFLLVLEGLLKEIFLWVGGILEFRTGKMLRTASGTSLAYGHLLHDWAMMWAVDCYRLLNWFRS